MTLIKTSLLNGIAVALKILALLGINKVLAIYVGAAGYALLGQFQNLIQLIGTVAGGAINTGIVKYTAEYRENQILREGIWRAAGLICFSCSIITSIVVLIFSSKLAQLLLHDSAYSSVFVCLAIALPFYAFNLLLLSVLNGKKEIHYYVIANIAGSFISLMSIVVMVKLYGLYGALTSLAIYQSLAFIVTLALCYKTEWFAFGKFWGFAEWKNVKKLLTYTIMALVTAFCMPVSHMLIRNYLVGFFGWEMAGQWDAMWRFSSAYLMFVTTTLSVYYLPRLSELTDAVELRKELWQGYRLIFPCLAFFSLIIYLFRFFLIKLLFTSEFSGMQVLFFWQLVGDFMKTGSWLLGFVLLARAEVKIVVFSEIIFSFSFLLLIKLLSSTYGFESTAIAHALNYLFHFAFMLCALKFRRII